MNKDEFLTDIKSMRKACSVCNEIFYYPFGESLCPQCRYREDQREELERQIKELEIRCYG